MGDCSHLYARTMEEVEISLKNEGAWEPCGGWSPSSDGRANVREELGREGRKNVSATPNTIPDADQTSSQRISTPGRPNPIAAEIPVNASGSRPKDGGTERELFSEDTETVLTFADGAVIRLQAAVAPGQLIFLTNLLTNQEVVCEVLRKRLRSAGCYVELKFTERKKGFWDDAPQGVAAQAAEKAKKALGPAESGTKTAAKGPETLDPSQHLAHNFLVR